MRAGALAFAAGVAGGAAASLCSIGWALASAAPVGHAGEALGVFAALLVAQAGSRAGARLTRSFAGRLRAAALLAATEGAVVGLGAFLLFSRLRPGLLADRFAAYEQALRASAAPAAELARELARLDAARAQDLDAAFQAVAAGGLVCFFALLLGAYGAFRARAAGRLVPPARD